MTKNYALVHDGKIVAERELDRAPPKRLSDEDYEIVEREVLVRGKDNNLHIELRTIEEAQRPGVAPVKPYYLPIEIENADFNPLTHVREHPPEWLVTATKAIKRYTVRPKTESEVAEMKAMKVAMIKAEAASRILAIMPAHQQTNAIAFGLEMTTAHGPDPAQWPAEGRAIYAATLPKWQAIKAIRARSNEIEASLPDDPEAIGSFDASRGWD